jgi:pantoate--beta-alanine ligase
MLVFEKIADLGAFLSQERDKGLSVGFVPTMGALHQGHISLILRSRAENKLTVCSIFVNPTQFNDKNDLAKYPKTLESDLKLLGNSGCEVVFVPGVEEIYPVKVKRGESQESKEEEEGQITSGDLSQYVHKQKREIKLGNLDKVMEGAQRPGHFAGVVQVVSRLFDIVEPDRAYFGQKDFQQQCIIREMGRQLFPDIEIITCPIVREPDGLAMSSRNVRLGPSERRVAGAVSQTLFAAQKLAAQLPVADILKMAEAEIAKNPPIELEYFQIVDGVNLQEVTELEDTESAVACIAVKLGLVRLIDNVILK